MSLRLTFRALKGEFEEAVTELNRPIAQAATDAMKEAAEQVKTGARASIAAAGFSKRWQNTLRVEVYPKRDISTNPAAFIYHRIPYADVFETGATIRGNPRLWIPLPSAPKRISRQRPNPKRIAALAPDGLQFIKRAGGNPLLAVKVRLSKSKADQREQNLTAPQIRRGSRSGRGVVRSVPVFVGVKAVEVRKRFNITAAVASGRDRLAALYAKNFRGD